MSYDIIETKAYARAIQNDIQLAFTDDQKLHSLNIQALIDWTKYAKETTSSEFLKKRFGAIQRFVDCNWGVINTLESLEKNLQDLIERKEKLAKDEIAVRKIQELRKFRLLEDKSLEEIETEFKKLKTFMTNIDCEKTFAFIPSPDSKTKAILCVYSTQDDLLEQYPVELLEDSESYVVSNATEYKNLKEFLDSFLNGVLSLGNLKDFLELSPHSNTLSCRLSRAVVEKKMSQLYQSNKIPKTPMWIMYLSDEADMFLSKMTRMGIISHAKIKCISWDGTYIYKSCDDSKEISLTRQGLKRYLQTFGKPIVLNEKTEKTSSN